MDIMLLLSVMTVSFYVLLRGVVFWMNRNAARSAHRIGQRIRRIHGLKRATACLITAVLLLYFIVDFFLFVNEMELSAQMVSLVARAAPSVGVFAPLALVYGLAAILILVACMVIRVEFTEPIHSESVEEVSSPAQPDQVVRLVVHNSIPRQ